MKFSEIIQSENPVLIDFFAEWCGPCKMMGPILKEVKQFLGEEVTIVKIDVDKNPQIASQLQIQGVPTLIMYQHGNIIWRRSGVVPKHELIKMLQPKKA